MPNFNYWTRQINPRGRMVYEYNPLFNYRPNGSTIEDLITTGSSQLNFDLEHPVDIVCLRSYDGSINLILNDNKNLPRLINTRFTPRENNTYERVDRTGNTDTNLYDGGDEFEIDTSLLKKYVKIPKVNFRGVYQGGELLVGNYVFYFKLADADGNETDFVAESGIVAIHMGVLNDPYGMRGGLLNENSGKAVLFILTNVDAAYDYVHVYYSRTTGADNLQRSTTAAKITNRYRVRSKTCNIHITGSENTEAIPVASLNLDFFLPSAARTQEVCQNLLFLGNVQKYTPEYETLAKISIGFIPAYQAVEESEALGKKLTHNYEYGAGYYNTKNIYNKVGYWNEEMYRFGIVYIMDNGSLSPVYNIRGRDNVPRITPNTRLNDILSNYTDTDQISIDFDTLIIDSLSLENSAGVCRIKDDNIYSENYFQVRNFIFIPTGDTLELLANLHIKGYFFVRLKRIPTILCLAFMLGSERYSGIPAWCIKNMSDSTNGCTWVTETFLDSRGYLTHEHGDRLVVLPKTNGIANVGICPEYELNQSYYNNIFTGAKIPVKQVTSNLKDLLTEPHHIFIEKADYHQKQSANITQAKVVSVPESSVIRDDGALYRNIAGSEHENTFQYLVNKNIKPKPSNFSRTRLTINYGSSQSITSGGSNVRIARGIYGTYLGIYDQNNLETNSLVNIYTPGYDEGLIAEYFKIRINCEDAYFPVTDRCYLTDFDDIQVKNAKIKGKYIYRGDCYISLFTHRINRNFQDPDAPNNDLIVSEDTWREKYDSETDATDKINRADLNAVLMGTYVTFKCYSTTNLALRDWDASVATEEALTGYKRSFYPLSSFRFNGHGKIPDSVAYNLGFSSTTGEKMNFLQPAVPYIKNSFQTRVIYSDIAQNDAFKNGFRVFRGVSYVDYDNLFGGIMKLVEWNGNLVIVFEHGIGLAHVNLNALVPTDDGTQIAIGAVKPLSSTPIMISTDFGTQWPESVCKTDSYIYGVDTVGKKIWRTDGSKFELISDFKVLKFLNDNITLSEKEMTPIIGVRNVKTHYNAFKHDIMFTYYDNTYGFEELVWNLCFNEHQNAFVTFYSWIPSYSANIDNIYFSFDRNTSKWVSKLASSISKVNKVGRLILIGNPEFDNINTTSNYYLRTYDFSLPYDLYYKHDVNGDLVLIGSTLEFNTCKNQDIALYKCDLNGLLYSNYTYKKIEPYTQVDKNSSAISNVVYYKYESSVYSPWYDYLPVNNVGNSSVIKNPRKVYYYKLNDTTYIEILGSGISDTDWRLTDYYTRSPHTPNEDEWMNNTLYTLTKYDQYETYYELVDDYTIQEVVLRQSLFKRRLSSTDYGNNLIFVKCLTIPNMAASGICIENPLITNTNLANGLFSRLLTVIGRPVPENPIYKFELVRDNFGYWKYFEIVNDLTLLLKAGQGEALKLHWFLINDTVKDPLNPCIQLNIRANISSNISGSFDGGWQAFKEINSGYYESLVFITLEDIYFNSSRERAEGRWAPRESNTIKVYDTKLTLHEFALPILESGFWKHGFAGLIDAQERIKPCFWYGKQHPFEFEYAVGNDNAGYKQFNNLTISSNNVAPDSIHYTIVGDSYDFALQKPAIYWRQEATKALYQFNGADLIYDHSVFDLRDGYLPEMITSSNYIERDLAGNPLRDKAAVSGVYKDVMFPVLYMRLDTFNEVEDFYKRKISSIPYSDYPNITGGEVVWDKTFDHFSLCNHVKCRDIKEVGRSRGNIQYINDKWNIQISPLIVLNRNNTWELVTNEDGAQMWLPKLDLSNVPREVYDYLNGSVNPDDFPPELGVDSISNGKVNPSNKYLLGAKKFYYTPLLLAAYRDYDGKEYTDTVWPKIANKRTEVKLLDKIMKTRIRYKGDKLVIILATSTSFDTV